MNWTTFFISLCGIGAVVTFVITWSAFLGSDISGKQFIAGTTFAIVLAAAAIGLSA